MSFNTLKYFNLQYSITKILSFCLILIILLAIDNHKLISYTPLKQKEIKEIINSDTRIILNLHGKWKRFYQNEYDYVSIPKSEVNQDLYSYEKTIKIDKNLIENFAFQFYILGFDDEAEIFINGQFLGRYFGGMTTFSVNIPPKLIIGEMNTIKIVVNPAESLLKKVKENTITSKKTYTGIIREIFLVATPKIWVNELKYDIKFNNSNYSNANVNVNFKISTSEIGKLLTTLFKDTLAANTMMKAEVSAKALLYDVNNNLVAESNFQNLEVQSQRTYSLNTNINLNNPSLWSPENPNLYRLKVLISKNGITIDELNTSLGFKELITTKANNKNIFSLNGNDFYIKAVSYVEDYSKSLQTISPNRIEEDIATIKTLGANVIRFKYNTPHPYLIHLCNKYGILAMIELPVYDLPTSIINSDEVKVRMENIMERNLANVESQPSVFAFGLYSGTDEESEEIRNYEERLFKIIRSNSKKLIFKTINVNTKYLNYQNYDFIGLKDNFLSKDLKSTKESIIYLQNLVKDKPLFINYGVLIQPNNKNGYSDPLSPEFQAYYLRSMFHLIKERELAGGCYNTYNDYRIENPLLISNNDDLFISYSGLVDINRNPRLSFRTLQTLYNQEKEPLLNVGSYSEKSPVAYIIVGIFAILLILFFINSSKRFKEYLIRSILRPYNFYADIRDQRIISTIQTIVLGFVLALSIGTFSSSLLFFYRNNEVAQNILMLIIPFKSLQAFLFKIIWEPEILMLFFTFLYFVLMFLVSSILRFSAIFIKNRVFLMDTMTISIWAGLPFIIILPISIILVKILVNFPNSIMLLLLMLGLISIWVLNRILKACAVVFDKPSLVVNFIGLLVIFILFGAPILFYHYKYQIFSYLGYIFTVVIGS